MLAEVAKETEGVRWRRTRGTSVARRHNIFMYSVARVAFKPCMITALLSGVPSGATCLDVERLEIPGPPEKARRLGGRGI